MYYVVSTYMTDDGSWLLNIFPLYVCTKVIKCHNKKIACCRNMSLYTISVCYKAHFLKIQISLHVFQCSGIIEKERGKLVEGKTTS